LAELNPPLAAKRSSLLLLLLSLLLSVFFRVPYFQYPFIFVDEAWWANGANVLCQGGQLYRDIALDKNPPIFWLCALLFKVFGIRMTAIHIGSLLLVFIISILLFLLGKRFFSTAAGVAAALIYPVASTTYYTPRIIGMNVETVMVLFSILAAYAFLTGLLKERHTPMFAAGLFAFSAFLTKPVALVEAAGMIVFILVHGSAAMRARIHAVAVFAAGFVLGLIAYLAYLIHAGILTDWWDQAIVYGFRYLGRVSTQFYLTKSIRVIAAFLLIFAWLWILVWLSRRERPANSRAYAFLVYWLVAACIGVAIGKRYYANYFVQVMPPLSILGGIGLVYLWRIRRRPEIRLLYKTCCAAFLISLLWFHSRTICNWAYIAFPEMHRFRVWDMRSENLRNIEIAMRLRREMSPRDSFFVWGAMPQLYFLTGRPAATKWVEFDVVDDYPPGSADHSVQAELADSLEHVRPLYILDIQARAHIQHYPHLQKLIERYYLVDGQVGNASLYRYRTPDSREVLDAQVQESGYRPETVSSE
jgi:hypothetical protein